MCPELLTLSTISSSLKGKSLIGSLIISIIRHSTSILYSFSFQRSINHQSYLDIGPVATYTDFDDLMSSLTLYLADVTCFECFQ